MDKKILLQNLADGLADRADITKRKAEAFVRSFFEISEAGLTADGIVKVKGFGTMKTVSVGDRESVNINTGERFQIEGHAKITFTPDPTFRDLVNRPFAHFSTIILDDDVDLHALNAVGTDASAPVEEAPTPVEEAPTVPVVNDEVEEPTAPVVNDEVKDPPAPVEEAPTVPVVNDEVKEAPAPVEEIPVPVVNDEPEERQPIIINNTIPAAAPIAPSRSWWSIVLLTLFVVALCITSYFAGYYRLLCPCNDDSIAIVVCPDTIAATADTTAVDSAALAKREAEATAAASKAAEAEAAKAEAAAAAEADAQRKAAADYEQFDGDWLITGVLETHEMAVGDNLYRLAHKAYGDRDLARYIILHNHLSNPDHILLGQKIEIPRLTHK